MPNAEIELHDSRVTRVHVGDAVIVLEMNAYVHMSEGAPGVDVGTGWMRPFHITVTRGVLPTRFRR